MRWFQSICLDPDLFERNEDDDEPGRMLSGAAIRAFMREGRDPFRAGAQPRLRVPAGSVAIGGAQTGIYPAQLPGGWHLIGRTPLRLFDPARAQPSLLLPGDRVRFRAIEADEFTRLAAATA